MVNPLLHHKIIQSAAHPHKTAYIVHGILGCSKNWVSFAKQLAQAHHDWRFVLVDLRNHGESTGFDPPHTLQTCAQDLQALSQYLGAKPQVMIGHSFGAKVTLAYATNVENELKHAWMLDCPPGVMQNIPTQKGESSIGDLLKVLYQIALPIASRKALVDALQDQGISRPIALWMTTNLKESNEGFAWTFQLENISEMLLSYAQSDFWKDLQTLKAQHTRFDFVRAEKEKRWTPEILEHFKQADSRNIRLHTLKNAGHWVHIDNPTGLLELMRPAFL